MTKNFFNLAAILIFSACCLVSCDDTITGKDIDSKIIPSVNVSYIEYIQPVFEVKCNFSGCHEDATRAGGLALTTWAGATADPGIVFPGEPQNSRMVWTIDPGYSSATPMPPVGYPVLTINQIEGIKTWIKEGAKNN